MVNKDVYIVQIIAYRDEYDIDISQFKIKKNEK